MLFRAPIDVEDSDPTLNQISINMRTANEVAKMSMKSGNRPFGAILVAPNNTTILMSQSSVDTLNHAEITLLTNAAKKYSTGFLWHCTLYTTVEPCVMCAGAIYQANIGRLVYGMSERQLHAITGDHPDNPSLDIPCRSIFKRGSKTIRVWGPISEMEESLAQLHKLYWKQG